MLSDLSRLAAAVSERLSGIVVSPMGVGVGSGTKVVESEAGVGLNNVGTHPNLLPDVAFAFLFGVREVGSVGVRVS